MLRLSVIARLSAIAISGALLVALVACGGGSKAAMKAPAPPASAGGAEAGPLPETPDIQIKKLDEEITAALVQMKLDEPSHDYINDVSAQPMGAITAAGDAKCRPAPSDTCKTSCTLSDSVCSNADKICTLAKEMAGDPWASNKCRRANLTCEASHKKCCACQ